MHMLEGPNRAPGHAVYTAHVPPYACSLPLCPAAIEHEQGEDVSTQVGHNWAGQHLGRDPEVVSCALQCVAEPDAALTLPHHP